MPKTQEHWDHHFLRKARLIAEDNATCLRGKTAAIIVYDNRDVSSGYNGAPPGITECQELGECTLIDGHCARCNHAELNAFINALSVGVKVPRGSTVYTLLESCLACTRCIIGTRCITRVVWQEPYFSAGHGNEQERALVQEMIEQSGFQWEQLREGA